MVRTDEQIHKELEIILKGRDERLWYEFLWDVLTLEELRIIEEFIRPKGSDEYPLIDYIFFEIIYTLCDQDRIVNYLNQREEIVSDNFKKTFPLISAKLINEEAYVVFFRCAVFCEAKPMVLAKIVEPLLERRENGEKFLEMFSEGLEDDSEEMKVINRLTSFTQKQIHDFLNLFFPDYAGSGCNGKGVYYIKLSQ